MTLLESLPQAKVSEDEIQVGDLNVPVRGNRTLRLRVGDQGDQLTVESPNGEAEFHISFTDAGCSVSVQSADLNIASTKKIQVECEQFDLKTKSDLKVSSGSRLILLGREAIHRCSDNIFMNAAAITQQGP